MIDILFLAHKRPEFTRASWKALLSSGLLGFPHDRVHVYTDGDLGLGDDIDFHEAFSLDVDPHGGPVACTNHLLGRTRGEFIAKVDNDLIVCPGWLHSARRIMTAHQEVDLLGLEAWAPDKDLWPEDEPFPCGFDGDGTAHDRLGPRVVSHVGGIGLFRRRAFERYGLPTPNSKDGRYGFTEWQWQHPKMVKAFIDPPLPVFLLDHLPFDPWVSLSKRYEDEGIQRRQWGFYEPTETARLLWDWWKQK